MQFDAASQTPARYEPGSCADALDVLLIGCGLRGTGLLTANADLLRYRVGVVDASTTLGPGSFDRYRIDSNSYGHDFFGWVDPEGVYGQQLAHPHVRALHATEGSFALSLLASALRPFGAAIKQAVGPARIWTGQAVVKIEVEGDSVAAVLEDGRRIHTRFAALALGIRECLHADLLPWQGKTQLSRQIIEHGVPAQWSAQPQKIVITGGSHSAYAIANRLRQEGALAPTSEVRILQRSGTKLFYANIDAYRNSTHTALEQRPNVQTDVCPQTGNLFRYSGLRHAARETFERIATAALPRFTQTRVDCLKSARPWLDEADVVIQALGYESNCVPLVINGIQTSMLTDGPIVDTTPDGRLKLANGQILPLFVMGMNPYPYDDNSLTPTGQYAARGQQILEALSQRRVTARNVMDISTT
ncbi:MULTISPECIES: hypothetical protein [unclassified Pseudomonas]|uniref:hypothetical protein n=1 Tax=unclassified Pseudomonas TaxID=196821 RepID=UPI000C2FE0A0|nr:MULTISPECIES: hypothetical protein [unclassified Pseudomonas]MCU1736831.1 hypothetical protein [Pseudomonas sp. 20S_6.2_Bac1]